MPVRIINNSKSLLSSDSTSHEELASLLNLSDLSTLSNEKILEQIRNSKLFMNKSTLNEAIKLLGTNVKLNEGVDCNQSNTKNIPLDESTRLIALEKTHHQLKLEELTKIADSVNSDKGRAFMIYFGLEGTEMRYGISISEKTAIFNDGWEYHVKESPDYYIDPQTMMLVRIDDPKVFWNKWATCYHHKIALNRGSKFEHLTDNDARYVLMPYEEEVKLLIQDNKSSWTENDNVCINFKSIARHVDSSDGGHKGNRHGICLTMGVEQVDRTWKELIDNLNSVVIFHNKGADYGHLCPPRNNRYFKDQIQ